MLELQKVSFGYDGRGSILRDVNISVKNKEFVLIKGASGCGKSTLLRLMNRLNEPAGGEILFNGKSLKDIDVTYLRRMVCYIQQIPIMIKGSVENNIIIPYSFKSSTHETVPSKGDIRNILDEFLLQYLKLSDNALSLSVGEKQRIALIRGLLLNPAVMLLDEPVSALDEKAKRVIEGIIQTIYKERSISVVMVTHRDFTPESGYTQRTFVIENKELKEV